MEFGGGVSGSSALMESGSDAIGPYNRLTLLLSTFMCLFEQNHKYRYFVNLSKGVLQLNKVLVSRLPEKNREPQR